MRISAFALGFVVLAAPAQAQTVDDSRWTPFLGCWELITENVRDAEPLPSSGIPPTAIRTPRVADDLRPRVCVTAAPRGATFTTSVAGKTALEQTVAADGTDRPIDDSDCRGTQRAEWSDDGLRLYSSAQLTCGSDQSPRRVSALALLGPNGTWLDIQAIEVAGRENIRVRRYRRAALDAAAAPRAAVTSARLTLEDIKEASPKVSARALEAALVETSAGFDLTSRSLLDLAAADVPESVIDLVVALSYPDRFIVERSTREDRASGAFMNDQYLLGWSFGYPMWSAEYGFYSPLYGSYYSPYFYSPFAYSYLRGYDSRFLNGGGYSVIGVGGGTVEPQPSGAGRVVDGRGYTRVRERVADVSAPQGGSASSGGGGSSSGGSSGTASSGGYSGGGSSDGGGRTAVPR